MQAGWFEARPVGDGVTRIDEPFVDPSLRSNVWLVCGSERDALVDCGTGMGRLRPAIDALRGSRRRPVVAIATHAHARHIGGLHEFDERICHRQEAPMVTAAAHERLDPLAFDVSRAAPTQTLEDGDVLDLGDRTLRVLHLPGHTAGSVCALEERTGLLFAGDTLSRAVVAPAAQSDVGAYVASLQRLRELPVRVVHGGHGASFGGVAVALRIDEDVARCETWAADRSRDMMV